MPWIDKFEYWIDQGKTKEWLTTRLEFLHTNYPSQFALGEYEEILQLINQAYPDNP